MASCLKVGDEAERRGPNRKSYKRKKNTQRRPAQQDEADKKSKGRWGMWRPPGKLILPAFLGGEGHEVSCRERGTSSRAACDVPRVRLTFPWRLQTGKPTWQAGQLAESLLFSASYQG